MQVTLSNGKPQANSVSAVRALCLGRQSFNAWWSLEEGGYTQRPSGKLYVEGNGPFPGVHLVQGTTQNDGQYTLLHQAFDALQQEYNVNDRKMWALVQRFVRNGHVKYKGVTITTL